jgi:hypothetical protein
MARFVTAGVIDLTLCTYGPLGKSNSPTKFRSSLILGLATRGPKLTTQKVLCNYLCRCNLRIRDLAVIMHMVQIKNDFPDMTHKSDIRTAGTCITGTVSVHTVSSLASCFFRVGRRPDTFHTLSQGADTDTKHFVHLLSHYIHHYMMKPHIAKCANDGWPMFVSSDDHVLRLNTVGL